MKDKASAETPPRMITLADDTPMFIGDMDDVIPWARQEGYSFFYVVAATKSESFKEGNVTRWTEAEPSLFTVVSNPIGYAITSVTDNKRLKLAEIQSGYAWFEMPKMPWLMVQKLDVFFRTVYQELGTEAIVMLGYDPRKQGSDGWCFFVPEQTNNAGHCDYKPESIVEDKDDEVILVGTVHSHPGMSAFASGIDHHDQQNMDGLHITFGWQRGTDFTDVHLELQMDGKTYDLTASQVFETSPPPPKVPETKEWMTRVKKESIIHKPANGSRGTSKHRDFGDYQDPAKYYTQAGREYQLPLGAPDPKEVWPVCRLINAADERCPLCDSLFRSEAKERRRCWDCFSFIALPGETIADIIDIRKERNDTPISDLLEDKAKRTLVMWERWMDGEVVNTVTHDIFTVGKVPAQQG